MKLLRSFFNLNPRNFTYGKYASPVAWTEKDFISLFYHQRRRIGLWNVISCFEFLTLLSSMGFFISSRKALHMGVGRCSAQILVYYFRPLLVFAGVHKRITITALLTILGVAAEFARLKFGVFHLLFYLGHQFKAWPDDLRTKIWIYRLFSGNIDNCLF